MSYWKNQLPNFIHNINYEKLINDPEKIIKNLLKYLELKWDKNCMNFYKSKRPVQTASDVQVRKPLYKNSINSWKNYENLLPSIIKDLK